MTSENKKKIHYVFTIMFVAWAITLRTLVYRLCQKQSECFNFVLCSWNRNDRIGYFRYNPHKTKTKIQVIFKRIDDRKSDHLMHFVYDL